MQKDNNLVPVAFKFNATHQEIRSVFVEKEPWFVAKDVCDILGLKNSRVATSTLDSDEKADVSITYTSSNGTVQNRKVQSVSESGLYALILRSNKQEARVFRKWITSDVLPSIRKKGSYHANVYAPNTFTDLRDVPFTKQIVNGFVVRKIEHQEQDWYALADVQTSIGSKTCATQTAKKLNAKQELAQKFWLFGATHPAWFTNYLGLQLVVSSSRVFKNTLTLL